MRLKVLEGSEVDLNPTSPLVDLNLDWGLEMGGEQFLPEFQDPRFGRSGATVQIGYYQEYYPLPGAPGVRKRG